MLEQEEASRFIDLYDYTFLEGRDYDDKTYIAYTGAMYSHLLSLLNYLC